MSALPYLSCRNGTYYFRRTIPSGLRAIFSQTEVIRSLQTSDVRTARKAAVDMVCLPVHDAVAVQQEHLEWAKDTMLECWDKQMETNGVARVKVDLP